MGLLSPEGSNAPNFDANPFGLRFSKESVSNQTKVKASVQRGIVTKIMEQFPLLEPYIDDILPKKAGIVQVKWYASTLVPASPFSIKFDTLSLLLTNSC